MTSAADRHAWRSGTTTCRALALSLAIAGISFVLAESLRADVVLSGAQQQQRSDTVVRMAGAPRHRGVGRLVEELSIGGESGPDEYIFGQITEVGVGPDSAIYVFDYSVPILRKFDAKGKFVRSLGRGGQGPGEYGRVAGMVVARDGRVFLRDPSADRITIFSASGDLLESWTNGGSRLFTGDALQVDVNGVVYTKARLSDGLGAETGFIRMGAGGKVIDSLPPPRFDFRREEIQGVTGMRMSVRAGGLDTTFARGGIALPFAPQPIWGLSPLGYMVTGVPNRYAVELRIPRAGDVPAGQKGITPLWNAGQPVVSMRRQNVQRVNIGAEERELRRKATEEGQRGMDPRWQWVGPELPRVKPYYKRFEFGLDGRIFVGLHTEGERYMPEPTPARAGSPPSPPAGPRYREPVLFDIFEPTGEYVGQVAVPERHSVIVWWGDRAWGYVRDDLGVQTVKRWRITW